MSIKVTGGPTHRLGVTPYWGPRRWTKGPTNPLSIRVAEGPTFWWGPHRLTVHLGIWGSHTLSSEGPLIDCPSGPLRAPHIDSEPRRTEGPAYWWRPHRPIVYLSHREPHIFTGKEPRQTEDPTYWLLTYRWGPHLLTVHLGLWGPHTLTKSHSPNIRTLVLSLQWPSQVWRGPSQGFEALKYNLGLLRPGMGPQTWHLYFFFIFSFF